MFDDRKPKNSRKPKSAMPHDIDAERAVLGALLRDPILYDEVLMILREPDDFYHDAHKCIFSHMMKVRSEVCHVDLILLVNKLKTTGELDLIGGKAYLGKLMESVPITDNAVHYAKIVRKKAILRKLIDTGSMILRDAYSPEASSVEILNRVISATLKLPLCPFIIDVFFGNMYPSFLDIPSISFQQT